MGSAFAKTLKWDLLSMCVNYITTSKQIFFDWFRTPLEFTEDWRDEVYCDFKAPFIVHGADGSREGRLGTYGFVPQDRRPPKKLTATELEKYDRAVEKANAQGKVRPKLPRIRMDTMNARAEEVGSKRNYKTYWFEQRLCLVPALGFFEYNYESGKPERWLIELADKTPFAMPGLWRTWTKDDGTEFNTFTHFTLNADDHPLLSRFHEPDVEKRGAAILRPEHWDDWLCSKNPEFARALIELYPRELLQAHPAPKPSKKPQEPLEETTPTSADSVREQQQSLF